tara:strand:- start:823 stop:1035 length:213 start_codon:yes stop_codon:yes gene_type:complete
MVNVLSLKKIASTDGAAKNTNVNRLNTPQAQRIPANTEEYIHLGKHQWLRKKTSVNIESKFVSKLLLNGR